MIMVMLVYLFMQNEWIGQQANHMYVLSNLQGTRQQHSYMLGKLYTGNRQERVVYSNDGEGGGDDDDVGDRGCGDTSYTCTGHTYDDSCDISAVSVAKEDACFIMAVDIVLYFLS